jgi:GR25 family glycosyltransferase involved in LPS biosynthesis
MTARQISSPVFVVSLARAPDRRRVITQHLAALGIPYRLLDAVDGKAMSPEEVAKVVQPGRTLHPGAIGCYLSHVHIYEAMLREQISLALVLEDDARLSPRCPAFLSSVHSIEGFDYCFLDSDDQNDRGPIYYDRDDAVTMAPGIVAHRLSAGPQTTHAYLITLEGARKRVAHAYPMVKPIDLYDHLPYPIVFRAVVSPKLAWVSEQSLVSFTSNKVVAPESLSFPALRRFPLFYQLRDIVKLRTWRRSRAIRGLVSQGLLAAGRRWAPLPSGRDVLR